MLTHHGLRSAAATRESISAGRSIARRRPRAFQPICSGPSRPGAHREEPRHAASSRRRLRASPGGPPHELNSCRLRVRELPADAMLHALPHPVFMVSPDGKHRRRQCRGRTVFRGLVAGVAPASAAGPGAVRLALLALIEPYAGAARRSTSTRSTRTPRNPGERWSTCSRARARMRPVTSW